ncbi:MAG: TraB/GumN family protein [Candidatus Schekmanbacteria bacterium]|nr:TraB/GumN family protein [Candidatus Schekmanbacteria bacterium]
MCALDHNTILEAAAVRAARSPAALTALLPEPQVVMMALMLLAPTKNCTVLQQDGRTIYLVGTAHVSADSVAEVRDVISAVRPDTVCVELCEGRYKALTDPDRWKNLDIFQVIREGKTLFLMASLILGSYQRRLGEQLGILPGAEMIAGIESAEQIGAKLVLADRAINVTLRRTWLNVPFHKKIGLLAMLLEAALFPPKLAKEDIEQLKEEGELASLMESFAEALPEVKVPIIDERDAYLMSSIEAAEGATIVAIVGAGHVEGMKRHFGQEVDREALDRIPPPPQWVSLLKWLVPVLVIAAFYVGYSQNAGKSLQELVYAWVVPTSITATLCTALAGGRLVSVLVAFVAAPITTLHPLLGAGMVVGLVEAWLRKPTVSDCEKLNTDIQSLRGLYRNPFSRVMLVVIASTIGAATGAWIGLSWIVAILSG